MRTFIFLLCSVLLCFNFPAISKDLGVYGHLYPIGEEDFLVFIHKRLDELKANGQLAKMKNQFIERAQKDALSPTPLKLSTTDNPKVFYYDPTFVLGHNIYDASGHLLFPKGTRVNPLSKFNFDETWLFFDARDPKQVIWAKHELKSLRHEGIDIGSTEPKAKVILTGGNIKAASKALHVRIYFDQLGKISKKLRLLHVPSIVTGDGLRLKIEEVKT